MTPLPSTVAPDAAQRCLLISFDALSPRIGSGASVCVRAAHVAGHALGGLPLIITVIRGIKAPLTLPCASIDRGFMPCISPEGWIYCPPGKGPVVLVFDADGSPLPGIRIASLGLSGSTRCAAYAHGDAPSLLLANVNDDATSRLVAVDPATHAVRWMTAAGSFNGLLGVAALPSLGIVIVANESSLFAHRLSDGSRVGSLNDYVPELGLGLAADPATGVVYSLAGDSRTTPVLRSWLCVPSGKEIRILSLGSVSTDRLFYSYWIRRSSRLVVVPPALGKCISHLVISTDSNLSVLSLPSLAIVHSHEHKGMQELGLVADPWGGALAVCKAASNALHVLAWPLWGMPPLE